MGMKQMVLRQAPSTKEIWQSRTIFQKTKYQLGGVGPLLPCLSHGHLGQLLGGSSCRRDLGVVLFA